MILMHTFMINKAVALNPWINRPCECYTKVMNPLSTILSSAYNDWLSPINNSWYACMNFMVMVHCYIPVGQSLEQPDRLCSQTVHQNNHHIRIWRILLCIHACMHAFSEEGLVVPTSHAIIALRQLYIRQSTAIILSCELYQPPPIVPAVILKVGINVCDAGKASV